MLLEEDIPGPVADVETKIIDPNTISAAAATNSGIKNTTGVYDDSKSPTYIFRINPIQQAHEVEPGPTTEAEPDYEDDEVYAEDNGKPE